MLIHHNLEEKSRHSKFVQNKPGNVKKKIPGNTRLLVESENKIRALKKNSSVENLLLRFSQP